MNFIISMTLPKQSTPPLFFFFFLKVPCKYKLKTSNHFQLVDDYPYSFSSVIVPIRGNMDDSGISFFWTPSQDKGPIKILYVSITFWTASVAHNIKGRLAGWVSTNKAMAVRF